jgi:hypothetical protein
VRELCTGDVCPASMSMHGGTLCALVNALKKPGERSFDKEEEDAEEEPGGAWLRSPAERMLTSVIAVWEFAPAD